MGSGRQLPASSAVAYPPGAGPAPGPGVPMGAPPVAGTAPGLPYAPYQGAPDPAMRAWAELEAERRRVRELDELNKKLMSEKQSWTEQQNHERLEKQQLHDKATREARRAQDEAAKRKKTEEDLAVERMRISELESELQRARSAVAAHTVAAVRTPPPKQPGGAGGGGSALRRTPPGQGPPPPALGPAGAQPHPHPLLSVQPQPPPAAQPQAQALYRAPSHPMDRAGSTGAVEPIEDDAHAGGPGPAPSVAPGVGGAVSSHQTGALAQQPRADMGAATAGANRAGLSGRGGGAGGVSTMTTAAGHGGTAAAAQAAAAAGAGAGAGAAAAVDAPQLADATVASQLLSGISWLGAARLPVWQHLWASCPDALTALLHPAWPTPSASVPALPAATIAAAAGLAPPAALLNPSGGAARGGSSASAAAAAALPGGCGPVLEGVRAQLRVLAGGLGDGRELACAVLGFLKKAAEAAAPERPAERRSSVTGGAGAGGAAPGPSGAAAGGGGGGGGPGTSAGPSGAAAAPALRPWVARCMAVLAALLAGSEACRQAVGVPVLPGAAYPPDTSAFGPSTSGAPSASAGSSAPPPGLWRGGLPYLLPAASAAGGGANAGALAARALRRQMVRSYVLGANPGSGGGAGGGSGGGGGGPAPMDVDVSPAAAAAGANAGASGGSGGGGWALAEVVRLLMRVCELYGDAPPPLSPAASASAVDAPPPDVLQMAADALAALGAALPPRTLREALLPVLLRPCVLLCPLLARAPLPPRISAVCLLQCLLESPAAASALTAALMTRGVVTPTPPANAARDAAAGAAAAGLRRSNSSIAAELDGAAGALGPESLDPAAAVELTVALLDELAVDDWTFDAGSYGPNGAGAALYGTWGPYELPRRVLCLLAGLAASGQERLLGQTCHALWTGDYGLPQRLLALADAACTPPGSPSPTEPVYPASSAPSLQCLQGSSVPPAEWMQRLRLAQEAMLLLKEVAGGTTSDELRAPAIRDLIWDSTETDRDQLRELAPDRMDALGASAKELFEPTLASQAGLPPAPLAPWAARMWQVELARREKHGPAGGDVGQAPRVACSVEAVAALAKAMVRRFTLWYQHGYHQRQ
ncbi:hypothetical protein HYH03_012977 [Edaphochlamys debaryana]|uniref:Uncharacterized protein n=1 Tax=Edaphochlamys debaryana TaxID=47281 RepID=A0A836BTV8_9CHLO|nr:hypothetical protein HYH03_012977 [Edaphochlamys debaryana]|eukprot:KAG2488472.1 hypothetical protein HYH03_012977 [Edaphochlamys debaryana]